MSLIQELLSTRAEATPIYVRLAAILREKVQKGDGTMVELRRSVYRGDSYGFVSELREI